VFLLFIKRTGSVFIFVVSIFIFIAMMTTYQYAEYQSHKEYIYTSLDNKLKAAALSGTVLLDSAFLDSALEHKSVDDATYMQMLHKLSKLAKHNNVVYIYILVQKGDKIHFLVSSATDEEIASNEGITYFYDEYDDAPEELKKAFETKQTLFAEYSDKWGDFRSVFIPIIGNNNELYITGADVQIDRLHKNITNAAWERAIQVSLIIVVGFVLFFWQLFISNKRLNLEVEERTKELLSAKNEAEEAVKIKAQFLANMSHEIRTPMNAILGFLQVIIRTEQDEKKLKRLTMIKNAGESLLMIINDILDFSKLEAGKLQLSPVPFSLSTLIENVQGLIEQLATQKNITLEIMLEDSVKNLYNADSLRLEQVLINLLNNAIKFSDENSKVALKISLKKSMQNNEDLILFSIEDQGIGISLENQKKLFNPFSQSDASSTRKYGGTGLGLAICKQIVELMGGTIAVQSQEGEGSRFYFTVIMPKV
jgi:signal transduction histidine kinase